MNEGKKKMDLNTYQQKAKATAIYPETIGLQYTILGLAGEAGEVANLYKKVLRDDEGILTIEKRASLIDELGDVLWYLAMISEELDEDLETIAKYNLQKLARRKFLNTLQDKNREENISKSRVAVRAENMNAETLSAIEEVILDYSPK